MVLNAYLLAKQPCEFEKDTLILEYISMLNIYVSVYSI